MLHSAPSSGLQATRPLKQPHATLLLPHAPNHLALPTYTNPPVTSTHHLLISVTSVMSYKCRALQHTEGRGSSHTPLRLKVLAAGPGGLAGALSRMLCSLESREGGGAHQDDGACGRGVIFLARCRDLSSHACVVLDFISTPSIHTYCNFKIHNTHM